MGLFQHVRNEFFGTLGDIDRIHLGAGNHDVARAKFGDLKYAFDHRQRIGVDQVALVRILQNFEQLTAGFGFRRNEVGQALQQRAWFVVRFDSGLSTGIWVVHVGAPAKTGAKLQSA